MVQKQANILVVDDESIFSEIVCFTLNKEGFSTTSVASGVTALQMTKNGQNYDLFVLDVKMPEMNGYELCSRLRAMSDTPIIFLSSCTDEDDIVKGLELGADDYIRKPFSSYELSARVRAVLRRCNREPEEVAVYTSHGLKLRESERTAMFNDVELELTQREFELLAVLMKNAGNVLSREMLLKTAWGWTMNNESNTVNTHVMRLREKLSNAGCKQNLIETVRGYGYRFVA